VDCFVTLKKALTHKFSSACLAAFAAVLCLSALDGCQQASNVRPEPAINHLKTQTSPYLLAHSNDPVNWYPWGDEAFAVAKRANKPVFLSSGFAACHWCHVMHRESFEDAATAKMLNDNFVSIKVDREELPYVDEVYSRAAQAIGGRGGWPLTVFLTPDRKPFFAGTYFPKTDMYGLPAFTRVLSSVLDSWHKRRGDIDKIGNELCVAIYNFDGRKDGPTPDIAAIKNAGATLLNHVDKEYGGVYGERKFALPGTLALAMQLIVLDQKTHGATTKDYLAYLTTTLNQMALGGVHDQLHGGFFRYATDRFWRIPHFEKMLSDNALIAQTYLDAGLLTGNCPWKATGLDTLDFCLKEFATEDGTFNGSIDADSGGQEGAFYTFSEEEIYKVLGADDGKLFCTALSIGARGNNKDGRSVLYLSDSPEKLAHSNGLTLPQFQQKLETLKTKLAQSETVQKRVRPTVDSKVITAWNALMISALVDGYKVSGDDKYLAAAKKCADFLLKNLCQGKTIERVWAGGKAEIAGCLDDYAYTIRALLDLASVDSDPTWLSRAGAFNDTVVGHFFSHRVGLYYTANNKEQALVRTGCARDNGVPSPAGIEVANLVRLYEINSDSHLKSVIERTVKPYGDDVVAEPANYGYLLAGMDLALHTSGRLVILDGQDKSLTKGLARADWQFYAPHIVQAVVAPKEFAALGQLGTTKHTASAAVTESSAAYWCNSLTQACDKPITDPAKLRGKLTDLAANGGL
jgi:uncharacterized protein YyaL (SSP411 family)